MSRRMRTWRRSILSRTCGTAKGAPKSLANPTFVALYQSLPEYEAPGSKYD